MRRSKKIVWCAAATTSVALWASVAVAAPSAGGDEREVNKDHKRPRLTDLAWIQGHWTLDQGDDRLDEIWSPPVGDSMMGVFRWIKKGGKVWMFELLTIIDDGDAIWFRFKHFDRKLRGWEEKDESMQFRLARTTNKEAVFDNPKPGNPHRVIFRRLGDDKLLVRLEGEDKGKPTTADFVYHRKSAKAQRP